MPEYWVVDLRERQVVRHSDAGGASYRVSERVPFGEQLQSATLADLAVDTDGLLE